METEKGFSMHGKKRRTKMSVSLSLRRKTLTGEPLDDLVFRPSFIAAVEKTVWSLAKATRDWPPGLVGTLWRVNGNIVNAVLLLRNGNVDEIVVDDQLREVGLSPKVRTYARAAEPRVVTIAGRKLGIAIGAVGRSDLGAST